MKNKKEVSIIYLIMQRKCMEVQRKNLRDFEKKLLKWKKIDIG